MSGVTLRLDGTGENVVASAKPAPELLAKLKEHKPDIIAHLKRAADRETAAQSLAAARKLWPRAVVVNEVVVNEVVIEPIGVTMLGAKKP